MNNDNDLNLHSMTKSSGRHFPFSSWQVIWKTSTKLGIGYARTANRQKVYVVGRYDKHGNVGGQYVENVPKADYLFETFQDNCDGIT